MAKVDIVVRGNLGRDVETKFSKAGRAYSTLAVGSTPAKKNEAGEWENGETMWFNVTVFAELNPFEFKKGASVEIEGTFTAREYPKKDGTKGLSLDVAANDARVVLRDAPRAEIPASAPASFPALTDDLPF